MKNLNSSGYIALSTVLVILVVIIAITLTTTYTALNEAQSGLALFKGDESLSIVEGCTENLLLKARADSAYNGGTITLPEGNCEVVVNSKIGSNPVVWDADVTAQSVEYKRTIKVIFSKSSTGITLTSWKEQ